MFNYPKWLSDIRSHILEMARVWLLILGLKLVAWNIPNTVFAELNDRFVEADNAFKEAQAAPRSEILNTRVRVAFEKLVTCMKDIKDRYFKQPPLLDEDFVSLLLKPPKKKRSPIGKPTAQVTGDIILHGAHLVSFDNIRFLDGPSADPRADKWVYSYYGFTGPPTARHPYRLAGPPQSGEELLYCARTRRRNHDFDFDGESGNRIYFCLRLQNEKGESGPFGPISTIVIP